MYPTIHASLLLYAAALILLLIARRPILARFLYTLGLVLLFIHVALAYHFFHHWSQAHVLQHTADQTFAMTGVRSSAGVYLNYLFMGLWLIDAIWWWGRPAGAYRLRHKSITLSLHGFLLFIIVNAAIVFPAGVIRWVSAAVVAVIILLWISSHARERTVSQAEDSSAYL